MDQIKNKFKSGLLSTLMASLFAGGILFGGSEFTGFPWGPVIGAGCFVVLGLISLRLKGG